MIDKRIIKRGDIFYIDIPEDKKDKHKQWGCRPCIIVSNDKNNKYNSRVQYVPLTSKTNKTKLPTHVPLINTELQKESIALCECIDSIDKSFIKEKTGKVSKRDMLYIEMGVDIQLHSKEYLQFIVKFSKEFNYA